MTKITIPDTADLLACPFCGSEAEIEQYGDNRKSTIVACTECGCRLESGEAFRHGTFWNTRSVLAPDPLGAVKVKPLEWGYHPAGAIAAPPTGFAYIIDTRMKGRVYSLKGFNPQREFSSMDEAKAAAQADYEVRVLSALKPCDPLADPRVVVLVEALKDWLELAEHCSIADGVCCCGEKMENHSAPIDCGHLPVDHATYVARRLTESTRAALAALDTGGNDE